MFGYKGYTISMYRNKLYVDDVRFTYLYEAKEYIDNLIKETYMQMENI
jgi:hypothetical protein